MAQIGKLMAPKKRNELNSKKKVGKKKSVYSLSRLHRESNPGPPAQQSGVLTNGVTLHSVTRPRGIGGVTAGIQDRGESGE